MVILMATLFWALWDEDFGQRPWKSFQHEWKSRYSTFLKRARTQSSDSQKEVEATAEYQALKQAYESTSQKAAPRIKEINEKLRDLSSKILAVQNVFTDRRAYVNALTYSIETETSKSSKESKQKDLDEYKKKVTSVEDPDGSKKPYNFTQLEETYNELKNERTQLSAELGELIKPVNEKKNLLDAYVSDHMVSLTPSQLSGLQVKTEAWTPNSLQINVPHANIVEGQEARRERTCLRQPSGNRSFEDSRSGQVRLLTLSPGQRTRDHKRREGPRHIRTLVVAAVLPRKF